MENIKLIYKDIFGKELDEKLETAINTKTDYISDDKMVMFHVSGRNSIGHKLHFTIHNVDNHWG